MINQLNSKDWKESIRNAFESSSDNDIYHKLKLFFNSDLDYSQIKFLHKQLSKLKTKSKVTRIAILFSRTSAQLKICLQAFLLSEGIHSEIHESEFSTSMQDILNPDSELYNFKPDIILIGTHFRDIEFDIKMPTYVESQFNALIEKNITFFNSLWTNINKNCSASIIQNDIDIPTPLPLGGSERQTPFSNTALFMKLNRFLYSQKDLPITIHSIEDLSSCVGKNSWSNPDYFHRAKMHPHPDYLIPYAFSLSKTFISHQGLQKKCLILDLDGTLWGGIVGDDGIDNLKIGQGDPIGEAYQDFQQYCLALKNKGIILAVCSKNNEKLAKQVFVEKDGMILKLNDISCFIANWEDKASNIIQIAKFLNIARESCVFVDDTPAECEWVKKNLPEVEVIHLNREYPGTFSKCINDKKVFDTFKLVSEDANRTKYYTDNTARENHLKTLGMKEFLIDLSMKMKISRVDNHSIDRVVQLTNKSNQFNLCTKRTTIEELKLRMSSDNWLIYHASLRDKFGDNGLISIMTIKIDSNSKKAQLQNLLMSCRVLKREVEYAFLENIVSVLLKRGITELVGHYIPTEKNILVKDLLQKLSFLYKNGEWSLNLSTYKKHQHSINVEINE